MDILDSLGVAYNFYTPPLEDVIIVNRLNSETEEEADDKLKFIIIARNYYEKLPAESKKVF